MESDFELPLPDNFSVSTFLANFQFVLYCNCNTFLFYLQMKSITLITLYGVLALLPLITSRTIIWRSLKNQVHSEGTASKTEDERQEQTIGKNILRQPTSVSEKKLRVWGNMFKTIATSLKNHTKPLSSKIDINLLFKTVKDRRRSRVPRQATDSGPNCCLSCLLWGFPPQCSCKGC